MSAHLAEPIQTIRLHSLSFRSPLYIFHAPATSHILQASVMDALNAEAEKVRLMSEENNSLEPPLRSRSDSRSSELTLLNMSDTEMDEKRRSGDLEKDAATEGLLPLEVEIKDHVTEDPLKRAKLIIWMAINTVATVMIVSCHRSSPFFRNRVQCWNNEHVASNIIRSCDKFFYTNHILLRRSSVTKPSSATSLSDNVKPPSQPSTSSLRPQPSTSSRGRCSPCSTPSGSP